MMSNQERPLADQMYFTCDAHVVAVKGVGQAVGHHGVLQRSVAHFHT